jgi:glyoxylate reductase
MKGRVFVTHRLPGNFLKELSGKYMVDVWKEKDISRDDLLRKVKGSEVIVSLLTEKIDREVMEVAGSDLKVIANYAVGYDNVDVAEATKRGVCVLNTPGVLAEAVAEHVIALSLAVSRRIVEGDRFVREGKYKGWEPDLLIGVGLMGKTMGVVGLGRIGRWVGRLATGMGMKVCYYSRSRDFEYEMELGVEYRSFERLLKVADVVSLNVPLCEETKKMIGKHQFNLMKRNAVLINTARGGVVDEEALIEAIVGGKIAGAGLDVFENEERVSLRLRRMTNVVLTPHIASATYEARMLMVEILGKGLKELLSGKCPDNIVNKEVWDRRRL